jgi:hypothetical protein
MARPIYKVIESDRSNVENMARLGIKHEAIATVLGITAKTLRKHFRKELDLGMINANKEVLKTLFDMAKSGKNTSATIFWAKTRCGMRERGPEIEPSEGPNTLHVVMETK